MSSQLARNTKIVREWLTYLVEGEYPNVIEILDEEQQTQQLAPSVASAIKTLAEAILNCDPPF